MKNPVENPELKKLCDKTEDPKFCAKKVGAFVTSGKGKAAVLKAGIQAAVKQAKVAIEEAKKKAQEGKETAEDLKTCVNKYDHVVEELQQAFNDAGGKETRLVSGLLRDSLDYVVNCGESLDGAEPEELGKAEEAREELERLLNVAIKIKEEVPES